MVRTKANLKIKIREFVAEQQEPFKTVDVQEYSKTISSNIYLTPQRLQNYIRGTGAKFNKSKKEWIKPLIKI